MASTQRNDAAQTASAVPDISTSPPELGPMQEPTAGGENTSHAEEQATAGGQSPDRTNAATTQPWQSSQTPAVTTTPTGLPSKPVRKHSEALGPATEAPFVAPASGALALTITLQLTTGARHPYKIDEKYLNNRKVEAKNANGEFEPLELSGYKLKELIWTDWRTEWDPRPASPSSIRLIYLGKLLEDKKTLKDYALSVNTPNVIHMTVKPAEFDDDETAAKGGKSSSLRNRDGEEPTAGCRCVIL